MELAMLWWTANQDRCPMGRPGPSSVSRVHWDSPPYSDMARNPGPDTQLPQLWRVYQAVDQCTGHRRDPGLDSEQRTAGIMGADNIWLRPGRGN